ncbi:MAG: hypothetical protein ABSB49_22240 [Polyangia bacterium]|jgi:hypothetical protein
MFLLLATSAAGLATPAPKAGSWLTPAQARSLLARLLERQPFLASEDVRSARGRRTLGLFFGPEEYARLRGNPILGYWDVGGFKWTGSRIAWDGVTSQGSCLGITQRAWDVAFASVAHEHGLVSDSDAPLRMRGACLRAVIEPAPADPVRGVLMEMRLDSPTGSFLWRYSRGNPTIAGAVWASIELPVLMARELSP